LGIPILKKWKYAPELLAHLKNAKRTHEKDLLQGAGRTALPDALARKYPKPIQSGHGNSYFRRAAGISIGQQESSAATTSMKPSLRKL